jgi:hypothetical protein
MEDTEEVSDVAGLGKEIPVFVVSLGTWQENPIELPPTFRVRVARGSLDFLSPKQKLLARFPLRAVATWGFSQNSFQFQVSYLVSLASVKENLRDGIQDGSEGAEGAEGAEEGEEGEEGAGVAPHTSELVTIRLTTTEGALIDFATMATVKSLMEQGPEKGPEPEPIPDAATLATVPLEVEVEIGEIETADLRADLSEMTADQASLLLNDPGTSGIDASAPSI